MILHVNEKWPQNVRWKAMIYACCVWSLQACGILQSGSQLMQKTSWVDPLAYSEWQRKMRIISEINGYWHQVQAGRSKLKVWLCSPSPDSKYYLSIISQWITIVFHCYIGILAENFRKIYHYTFMMSYLILHVKRFGDRFFVGEREGYTAYPMRGGGNRNATDCHGVCSLWDPDDAHRFGLGNSGVGAMLSPGFCWTTASNWPPTEFLMIGHSRI